MVKIPELGVALPKLKLGANAGPSEADEGCPNWIVPGDKPLPANDDPNNDPLDGVDPPNPNPNDDPPGNVAFGAPNGPLALVPAKM